MSKIEWTEKTWNPIVGCTKVSKGCDNCYAITMARRLAHIPATKAKYEGLTQKRNGKIEWTGKMSFDEKALLEPLKRKKPTMYFVCSMGDLFHKNVPIEWVDKVFAVMAMCPQHTFQVLTKRPDRMELYLTRAKDEVVQDIENAALNLHNNLDPSKTGNMKFVSMMPMYSDIEAEYIGEFPLPNVWLGTSVENQKQAEKRIPHLQRTPAAVRFLSCEPLLERIDFQVIETHDYDPVYGAGEQAESNLLTGKSEHYSFGDVKTTQSGAIHWVIVGGESGAGARPMDKKWVEEIRLACASQAVPFFFKQWGDYNEHGERVGKKAASRLLNGKEYNEMPKGKEAQSC